MGTAYERLLTEMSYDAQVREDVTMGRRVGFYRVTRELGCGNFSQVKLGTHLLCNEKVAIKVLDKFKLEHKAQRLLAREMQVLEKLAHPNVIRLYEVCETISKVHLVTEYCSGGELLSRIERQGKIPERDARVFFAQLVAAVDHLHSLNVVHRDIKAENVYLAAPRVVKLGDFGFSTLTSAADTLNTCCGSPPYAAPELFRDAPYVGVYVDLWALGVLLFFMVTGAMPFRADNVPKLKPLVLSGQFKMPEFVSEHCASLCRAILRVPPRDRLSLAQIRRADWLSGAEFPAATCPDLAAQQKARHLLTAQYGVPEQLFTDRQLLDLRNAVGGTYRLLLHQIEKLNSARSDDMDSSRDVDEGYGSFNSVSDGQNRISSTLRSLVTAASSNASGTSANQQLSRSRKPSKLTSTTCSVL